MKKLLYGLIIAGTASAGVAWADCTGRCGGTAPTRGGVTAQCTNLIAMPGMPENCGWYFLGDPMPAGIFGGSGNSGNGNPNNGNNMLCTTWDGKKGRKVPVRRAATPTPAPTRTPTGGGSGGSRPCFMTATGIDCPPPQPPGEVLMMSPTNNTRTQSSNNSISWQTLSLFNFVDPFGQCGRPRPQGPSPSSSSGDICACQGKVKIGECFGVNKQGECEIKNPKNGSCNW